MPGDPFEIDGPPDAPLSRAALRAARPLLEWALQLGTLKTLYERAKPAGTTPFAARALDVCGMTVTASRAHHIPAQGPVVIVANHPHGALDGLVLASIVAKARPDVRMLANHLLARIPEMSDLCFFVDPFEGPAAAARSLAGLRSAHLWLRRGGALIVFPSGEVASRSRTGAQRAPSDSPWHETFIRLARSSRAEIVPAGLEGGNSCAFYAAGLIHPRLRTALLAREFLKKRGQRVSVSFAPSIAAPSLAADDREATQSVRSAVEQLSMAALRSPAPARPAIESEVAALPSEAMLAEAGGLQVFCSEASRIPMTLREIGRLRELTYRAVGEGTGRDLDLDRFDDHYLHLFSWDRERQRVVGAYRIGRTDRILEAHGVDGLYTRTLFRYDERLIARMSPALELGRSFVRAEYQRNYNALLLLWKGICRFIALHPEYRVLFGPVSISTRYSDSSHNLLMAFLQQNHLDESLAELVEALNPCAIPPPTAPLPASIEAADRIVSTLEADGKGVPVLLRQYLKLNARLIGFNVDSDFGEALDALMMVDLTRVDPSMLNRYFGREAATRFLQFHAPSRTRAA